MIEQTWLQTCARHASFSGAPELGLALSPSLLSEGAAPCPGCLNLDRRHNRICEFPINIDQSLIHTRHLEMASMTKRLSSGEVTLSCCVHRYDEKLQNLHKGQLPPPTKTPPPRPPLPTQQFGVSLQ